VALSESRPTPDTAKRVLAVVRGSTTAAARDLDVARDEVLVWPHLLYREVVAAMAVLAALWALSLGWDIPLDTIADPNHAPNPAKAPWYFLFLQEMLVYFDPWLAGVVVPTIIVGGLMAIPYLDPGTASVGEYTWRRRPLAAPFFVLGLAMWLVLLLIGRFLRGPSWAWYWPWESWSIHKEVVLTRDLPVWAGGPLIAAYFGLGLVLPALWKRDFYQRLGPVRYGIAMLLILGMLGVLGKIALRLLFGVKYVLVTPWLSI